MTEQVTPTGDLFVLSHLGVPRIDPGSWRLDVGGMVARPLSLDLTGLKAFPKRTLRSFHQCAGNPLEPAIPTRRVANVVWGGTDLADLLAGAGVSSDAAFLWSEGADHGEFAGTQNPTYLKDFPLARLCEGGCLLAYELNGEALPAEHGFPARLVVPGFYGTNSVKWLFRMTLADRRAQGPFTTTFYNDPAPSAGPDAAAEATFGQGGLPVWTVPVESVIVSPKPGARLARQPVQVWGWAWAASGVRTVEVSDDGETWTPARLEDRVDWSWQRFEISLQPATPGGLGVTLRSRATAYDGSVQPLSGSRNAVHAVVAEWAYP